MNINEWEREFDEKFVDEHGEAMFPDENGHFVGYKGVRAIKAFIQSLLDQQREEYVKMLRGLMEPVPDGNCYCSQGEPTCPNCEVMERNDVRHQAIAALSPPKVSPEETK